MKNPFLVQAYRLRCKAILEDLEIHPTPQENLLFNKYLSVIRAEFESDIFIVLCVGEGVRKLETCII